MSDREDRHWEKLCEANRQLGSAKMELVETLRRLASAWERLGHHAAAKDALARADRMLAKFRQEAA